MDSMGMTRILVKYSHSHKVTGKGPTRKGDHFPFGRTVLRSPMGVARINQTRQIPCPSQSQLRGTWTHPGKPGAFTGGGSWTQPGKPGAFTGGGPLGATWTSLGGPLRTSMFI